MEVVYGTDVQEFQNSQSCSVHEYDMAERGINGAVVHLKGRYPDNGCVVNLKCKELAYVISGSGKVVVEGKEIDLSPKDLVLILPNEKYFWEGNMTIFIATSPSWTTEQHRFLEG